MPDLQQPAPRLSRRACLVRLGGTAALAAGLAGSAQVRAAEEEFPPDRWIKVHQQRRGDAVVFRRQAHGGSCLDVHRDRLILFGSDTHGRDWTNSPLCFDLKKRRWVRLYPNDPAETYTVTGQGIPVAGSRGDHPWAMHTFGAVVYDPVRQEMIVASAPRHMVPGRFTHVMKKLWPQVKRFPTWVLDCKTDRWRWLPCKPVDFFPHSAAFDTDRGVVLGFRSSGIFQLAGRPRQWQQLSRRVFLRGWHNNCVYDSRHKALVVFGHNKNRNDVEVFYPATGRHRLMPTPGVRPAPDQHNPMAFHAQLGLTVVLVDRRREDGGELTETWLYDPGADRWRQVVTATLPFACGMNYNMEYDPRRRLLWLVTGTYRRPTTVWALRLTG